MDLRYFLILLAAFALMITAVGTVGFFLQRDIFRLHETVSETENRIVQVDKGASDARDALRDLMNKRMDSYRDNLNARIDQMNRIADQMNVGSDKPKKQNPTIRHHRK